MNWREGLVAAATVAAWPVAALAHPGADAGAHHGVLQGFLHPLTGADHLLAMVAVGAWGALRGGRARWLAPLVFLALLAAGATATAAGLVLPGVEPMVAASLLALGLLLAARGAVPTRPALAAIGIFAFFHGAAHGLELGAGPALIGMVLASGALHLAGLAAGTVLRRRATGSGMIPGELFIDDATLSLNPGRRTLTLVVENAGDRPIQVGSHYHFAETNAALRFDRAAARGMRLDIASGTAVRFEPGQQRTVTLVDLAGTREVWGFRGEVQGPL